MILQLLMAAASAPTHAPTNGCAIGNSTVAVYPTGMGIISVPDYTLPLLPAGSAINMLAVPGENIDQQKARWVALSAPTKAAFDWVICEVGLNDLDPAVSIATTAGKYQSMIDTIRADNATCKIIAATMTPCYQRLIDVYGGSGAAAQAKWVALNDAIMGIGSNAITGTDRAFDGHTAALDDGAGNLDPAYDTGDGIHENNVARAIIAEYWRGALEAVDMADAVDVDIYETEGQSNDLGVGASANTADYDVGVDLLSPIPRVWIYFYDDDALEPLHIPVNNMSANNGNYTAGAPLSDGTTGPEAGYAAAWLQDNPTGNLVILKDTRDGASIDKFTEDPWNTTRQARHAAAFAAIEAQGWNIRTRVWNWIQGEGNMADSQGSYQTALTNLIAAREADGTITEDTTIVLVKVPTDSSNYGAGVAAAMDAIAASDPTNIKVLAGTNSFNPDNIHKDTYGQMRDGSNIYAIAYNKTPIVLPGD